MGKTIDTSFHSHVREEEKRWKEILRRIFDVIAFLSKQNLSFRGHREDLRNETSNHGNFLELMLLLSKYDHVMAEHLAKLKETPYVVSYLSPVVQNELIDIIANEVRKCLLDRIRKSKYYSIMFDSTPDTSHVDQMCQIIRHVDISNGNVEVVESFIDYIPLEEKKTLQGQ